MSPDRHSHPLAAARSLLFVPADRPERLPKALASGAHAVIVDLEDAVAPAARPAARAALAAAWSQVGPADRRRVAVRVNGMATQEHAEDIALAQRLAGDGLEALVVPKAESGSLLGALAVRLGMALLPLIETAEGAAQLDAIAAAPGVLRLALGHIDLQADLGMACGPDEAELAPLRWSLVLASSRAGLPPPVDGVTTAVGDAERLAADTARARRFGFGGKLCIHPAQLPGVHAAFAPSSAQLDWARRVQQASAQAQGGVCKVDRTMVDAPVLALAQLILRDAPQAVVVA
ncbi:HpcH/HpaI aldolase/citrate lyase family protein [Paracidovorax wautersii]|uniref:Citrate lyase subunit beta / citryl-CoA lyase n=1 Tax=Paracidovorax wautersii TaxID=1177982 RepID=A0A1I2DEJ9_9BURK|nr:CoA ester lyase [Paracidovorax wautersii]SFE79022.1 citrate lyase subunit beta / citryl-CoA lyase [Paracidovorax wautersii]